MLVTGTEILQQQQNLTLQVKRHFQQSRNMMKNIWEGKDFLHIQLQGSLLSLDTYLEQANLSNFIS